MDKPSTTNDSQSPGRILRQAGRALRLGRGMTALTGGLVAAGLVLGAWLLLDAWTRFGPAGRWFGFVAVMLPLVLATGYAARTMLRRFDDAALARRLESATGRNDNALVNAVQLDRTLAADSRWRGVVLAELAGLWRGTRWQGIYNWRLLGRAAAVAGILLLVAGGLFLHQPAEFRQRVGRVLMPAREIAPVTRTRVVTVDPGDKVVAQGDKVRMTVTLAGVVPDEVFLFTVRGDGGVDRMPASRDGGTMTWSVGHTWRESGNYWFTAGDARSFDRRIDVRVPARVVARQLDVVPPAYTNLPPVHVADGTAWPAIPHGAEISALLKFDRGLAALTIENDEAKASRADAPEHWLVTGQARVNRSWKLAWSDVLGLSGRGELGFNVKADEAPKIRLIQPTGEEEILATRESWLKVEFEASDDFGLAAVAVCRGTVDRPDARIVQAWQPGGKVFRQRVDIPLSRWIANDETEAWFCVSARDANDITGPGRCLSRVLVVKIVSAGELQRASEIRQGAELAGLDELVRMQQSNLDETRSVMRGGTGELAALVERQQRIAGIAAGLIASTPAGTTAWRDALAGLAAEEMPRAVLALRDAQAAKDEARRAALAKADALQMAILARLKNLPGDWRDDAAGAAIRDLISRVEALFTREKAMHARVQAAKPADGAAMAADQDALADESRVVRQALADGAVSSSIGDTAFRAVLAKAAGLMGEVKIYEQMIACAGHMETAEFTGASAGCKQILVDLARVLELLESSRRSSAGDKAESLKDAADDLRGKLAEAIEQQKAVVEKSKELANKDSVAPEDEAQARELAAKKDALAKMIEQMLTDAHVFPDLRPMNELREELTKIYEDVIQQDAEQAAAGQLKPSEIAVQKEEGLLEAMEKAAETAEDMEMWLPDKNETAKWLMENFDLTEMPEIPNLPLPDSFTDLVGDLLKEQEGLAEQVQDAASNNAFAVNPANGWEVADGPMPGFNAQGKSGNTPPNKNEQTGRSSGGREGMSSGEMVNKRADRLEGSSTEARRTNDPLQQGHVQDDGPPADAKATGGGKAGGASQREGMTGEAPLRPVNAPGQMLNNALAAEQAMLAQQTAKSYATARLFYLRTGELSEVVRLMDESREALKAGRLAEYEALHKRIVANLRKTGGGDGWQDVDVISGGARVVGEKRTPGGADAVVPAGFQHPVDDYFRSLDTP